MNLLITYHNGDAEVVHFENDAMEELETVIISKFNLVMRGTDSDGKKVLIPMSAIRSIRPEA